MIENNEDYTQLFLQYNLWYCWMCFSWLPQQRQTVV